MGGWEFGLLLLGFSKASKILFGVMLNSSFKSVRSVTPGSSSPQGDLYSSTLHGSWRHFTPSKYK